MAVGHGGALVLGHLNGRYVWTPAWPTRRTRSWSRSCGCPSSGDVRPACLATAVATRRRPRGQSRHGYGDTVRGGRRAGAGRLAAPTGRDGARFAAERRRPLTLRPARASGDEIVCTVRGRYSGSVEAVGRVECRQRCRPGRVPAARRSGRHRGRPPGARGSGRFTRRPRDPPVLHRA